MCFSGQTLSAFVDGELGIDQQRSVKEHLQLCSACRKEANSIVILKDQLKIPDHEADLFTREAVWTRLSHSTSSVRGLDFWHRGFILSPTLMVSLSFLFITVLGISLFFSISNNSNLSSSINSNLSFEPGKYPLEIPVDNVENVLSYFNIHDEPLEFIIQLPGPSDFVIL
jgi:predicted anti-sigma-YlaC factor YlaD